jgi:hypothetical protein
MMATLSHIAFFIPTKRFKKRLRVTTQRKILIFQISRDEKGE